MPRLRSATSTQGRNMAGARALWRATGMTDGDFGKPIIAVVNSFTQLVPGHVHLKDMGHSGMLYSLPSRDLIADSVDYMISAHCADAMVCISNCDPMEAGKTKLSDQIIKLDLVDAMIQGAVRNRELLDGNFNGDNND